MRKTLPVLLTGMMLMNSAQAGNGIHTPEAGSDERRQVLDAVRAPLEKKLGQDVRFDVGQMKVGDGWGFLYARMQGPDGGAIDYAKTPLADAAREGYISPVYVALLQRVDEHWQLRAEAIGPTDLAWADWSRKYGAPQGLFEGD